MKIIDLTHPIHPGMPIYPGDPEFAFESVADAGKDGYNASRWTLGSHTGTHVDAPAHVLAGAAALDRLEPGLFFGEACRIDLKEIGRTVIEPADLEPHRGRIVRCEFVLLDTGWSRFWGTDDYFTGYPVLSSEAARRLAGFDLKGIAIDCPSADASGADDLPVHRILMEREILIVENLASPDRTPLDGFVFVCFPLPIAGGDGSPVRAVALIDSL